MTYRPIQADLSQWPSVEALVRGPLECLYFCDVHDLLRLPLREAGLAAGCNFAIAHVLLASISGLSTTLYRPTINASRRAFENFLIDFYPWHAEPAPPTTEEAKRQLAHLLYEEFRGPLTHHLGLWTYVKQGRRRVRDRGYAVKFKRIKQDSGNGLSEEMIEQIEMAPSWPLNIMSETLELRQNARVLKLERFYWGVRQTVVRLTSDTNLMRQAEDFLSNIDPAS